MQTNNDNIAKLKRRIKELETELLEYKKIQERAFTDFQNKQILEQRHKEQVELERTAERNTRSLAQQMRREEEAKVRAQQAQGTIRRQQAECSQKMVAKWEELFASNGGG